VARRLAINPADALAFSLKGQLPTPATPVAARLPALNEHPAGGHAQAREPVVRSAGLAELRNGDRLKFDAEGKIALSPETVSLRIWAQMSIRSNACFMG